MYARFSPQQVVHAVGRGCGCAGSRYSAVKSSVAQSTAACAGPAIGGGPARRQPAPPQGAEALALTGRRTMKARGTRPRLSTTFYRWAKPSLTVQPPWNRQAPCDSAVYCGRIFRLYPDFPKGINTMYPYILRGKLSVRPAQVGGIDVNTLLSKLSWLLRIPNVDRILPLGRGATVRQGPRTG